MVFGLPLGRAVVTPATQTAGTTRLGTRSCRTVCDESQVTILRCFDKVFEFNPPKTCLVAVSENKMHRVRKLVLDLSDQLGIESELEDVLRAGRSGELGVDYLITVCAETGSAVHLAQEIGKAVPGHIEKGSLVDIGGPRAHRGLGQRGALFQRAARGDLRDRAGLAQLLEVTRFVRVPGILDQHRRLVVYRAVGERCWIAHLLQIESCCMAAPQKCIEVGCRVQEGIIVKAHGAGRSFGYTATCCARRSWSAGS